MKPTVYVETSVIGYLIVAARQKITRDWWRDAPAKYELIVTYVVLREAGAGDPKAVKDRLAVLQSLSILPVSQEAQVLVNTLLAQGAVPITEPEDAAHIALAAVNGIEYLVTWNFKHIANASLRKKINGVCAAAGYVASTICSPEELSEVRP